MSALSVIVDFLKTWFLPMPAHDDPRFAAAQLERETEPNTPAESAPPSSAIDPLKPNMPAQVDALETEELVEQVYGEPPVIDPIIAEGLDDPIATEDYDPEADRDFAPGEPDENDNQTDKADVESADLQADSIDETKPGNTSPDAQDASDNPPVKKVDPLPAGLPEAAEARASRTHARINPFSED